MAEPHLLPSPVPSRRHPSSGALAAALSAAAAGSEAALSELMARAAAGDGEALAALYDATSTRVYGLVLAVVRSQRQAEKVTQRVYVEIWRDAQVIAAGLVSPLAALMTLAHRLAVEDVRAAAAAEQRTAEDDCRRVRLTLPRATRLQAALLSPVQQEVMVLSYLGGYTVGQVSSLLSLPADAVAEAITAALSSGLGVRSASLSR